MLRVSSRAALAASSSAAPKPPSSVPSSTVTTSGNSSTALSSVRLVQRLGEAGVDDADVQAVLAQACAAFTHVGKSVP